MNISHYIQELLFTKQKVVLPYIGSFEMVSKPAHIDGATGTITPPSKTIKFNHNEGTDYSVLVNHIAKRNGISTAKALKLTCAYSEEINNRLHNGEEVEIVGIGILRVIGSGTVIFLPFSSYSNLGESFGLPTISIKKKITPEEIEDKEEEEADEEPESEVQHIIEEAAFSTVGGERKLSSEEEEPFELIEDFIEEEPIVTEPQPQKTAQTEQKEEPSEALQETPIEEFGEHEVIPEVLEPEVQTETEKPSEKIEAVIPVFEPKIKERRTEETSIGEKETKQVKESPEESQTKEEPIAEESLSAKETKNIATPKKSRRSWIWPSLVIICILAIALVALYHYNPNIFSFIIPSDKGMVLEPAVPSDVDSSYYKTLASAAVDTSTAIDDSTRIDSARANLQKIDSTSKKAIATKATVKTPSLSGKKPMSKEEMEALINEKLKLGSATPKVSDTPQKAATNNKQLQEVKQPKQVTGGYQVIAASVETMKEAQKIAELLKAKGYNPQILESGKNRIRISIGSYPTSRQAVNAANAAKSKIGSGVWILNPQ